MRSFALAGAVALTVTTAGPAIAATYTATPGTLPGVFASAQAGDTIRLVGSFGRVTLADRSFVVPLRLDATQATFSDTMMLNNVDGLAFSGGYFGSTTKALGYGVAVKAYGVSNISFDKAYVVGAQVGQGIAFIASTGVTVTGSTFDGLKSGVGIVSSTGAVLSQDKSINSSSDGFDVADSHVVSVTNISCTAGTPGPGAHADCVQLYSIAGNAPQSDIHITDNFAYGPTQGFTSFNPMDGGGLRIDISRNLVETSDPQGIACYACVDSIFIGNTVTTLPGAAHRTGISIVGGSDNLAYGNTINGAPAPNDTDPLSTSAILPEITDDLNWTPPPGSNVTSSTVGDLVASPKVATIPEPGIWLTLLIGFAAAGGALRGQRLPGNAVVA